MARIRNLFTSPPAGSGLTAHTVYSEDDFKAVNNKTKTPVRPCIFLLDEYMRPQMPALPMVIVELPDIVQKPFELGNRNGRTTDLIIHSFGRQRGETEDLASFLQDNFGPTFPVYDYTSGSSVFSENAEVDDTVHLESHVATKDAVRQEGSIDFAQSLNVRFRTKV